MKGRSLIAAPFGAVAVLLALDPALAQDSAAGTVTSSLSGLPLFLAYFCLSLVVTSAYLYVYTSITPHDEFELIRKNVPGAAVSLGLSLLGFALPVASAVAHAANLIDCIIWSVIALIVQVIIYYLVRIPVPDISKRIAAGELAPAIWLGLSSATGGLLSAASMTWGRDDARHEAFVADRAGAHGRHQPRRHQLRARAAHRLPPARAAASARRGRQPGATGGPVPRTPALVVRLALLVLFGLALVRRVQLEPLLATDLR